jgi:toxin ParE1/3/4
MAFKIKIEPEALEDIQQSIDWYNEQQAGLGIKFFAAVKKGFKSLMINPFFQIRYDNVRCLPLKKYPFMVHFTVNEAEKLVVVRAIFNTSLSSDYWKSRK